MATTQLLWFGVGLSAMVLLAGRFRDDGILRHYKYTWALAGTLLLVITFLFGREVNGARLWIFLGPIGFQPGRERDLRRRQVVDVRGEVVIRHGVGVAARRLDSPVELVGRHALGLGEHQVLEQVGQAGLTGRLVLIALGEGLEHEIRHAEMRGAAHQQALATAPRLFGPLFPPRCDPAT
jgi:hypothetical protein